MKNFLILLLFIAVQMNTCSYGQLGDSTGTRLMPKQYASMSLLGHSIVSFNYEHRLIQLNHFSILGEIGIGIAEFPESEAPNPIPAVLALNLWLPVQYSLKGIEFTACVSPTIYKRGNLSFIDVNGTFGARTNFSREKYRAGPFLGVYYTTKVYRTVSNPDEIYFFTPISLKFGTTF